MDYYVTCDVCDNRNTFTTPKKAIEAAERLPSVIWKISCIKAGFKLEYVYLLMIKSKKLDSRINEKLCSLSEKYKAEPIGSEVRYWVCQKTAGLDDRSISSYINRMIAVYIEEEIKQLE